MEVSAELRGRMQQYYDAARRGHGDDASAFLSHQDGFVVIGTDPDEWWDREGYSRAMRTQAQELGGEIPIEAGDIHAFREGSVGWVVDRPRFRFPDGTEVPARATVIYHLEDDAWRIVHLHLSLGIPNEEALGQELTI